MDLESDAISEFNQQGGEGIRTLIYSLTTGFFLQANAWPLCHPTFDLVLNSPKLKHCLCKTSLVGLCLLLRGTKSYFLCVLAVVNSQKLAQQMHFENEVRKAVPNKQNFSLFIPRRLRAQITLSIEQIIRIWLGLYLFAKMTSKFFSSYQTYVYQHTPPRLLHRLGICKQL